MIRTFGGKRSRYGVILAGGDGTRLLPLTRQLTGDERPKQFCKLVGDETLLGQTRRRVSRLVPPRQTLLVTTVAHEPYYREELRLVPANNLVVQPRNQGTAAAIAYSLMRVRQVNPSATVAFFPSDHHFANEDALTESMETAFRVAEVAPSSVSLLGIVPDAPEVEYGWIEPGQPLSGQRGRAVFHVNRFWEKPALGQALTLMGSGCLWNSFVMVGRVDAFLGLISRTVPAITALFESVRSTLLTPGEREAVEAIYTALPVVGFSDAVLAAWPANLKVVRGEGLGWSDLGSPRRVLALLRTQQLRPVAGV